MSLSTAEFWRLVIESQLLSAQQCQALGAEYGRVKGAAQQDSAKTLAQWLISRNALSKYQTTILLAGRSGPFHYGDYRVYDMVDKGRLTGMFRAVHIQTNHRVMLQFLTGADVQDPQRWALLANRLQNHCSEVHPHLLRAFEVVDLGNFKFLVLEDILGESLEQRLTGGTPFGQGEACRLVRQAAMGLAQLQQAGHIHGDIRPYNLWLDTQGNVKLLFDPNVLVGPVDFAHPDGSGQLIARADYMAPELGQPNKAPDALTDIYSLGCTLFHLLTGRPPFMGGDVQSKLQRHAGEPIQPLEPLGIPQHLSQLVAYAMAKNPGVRYQQASVVATQLASFVPPEQLHAIVEAPPMTLAAFDGAIRMKQSRLATSQVSATAPQPSSFPTVAASSPSAGPSIVADDTPLHQRGKKKSKSKTIAAASTDVKTAAIDTAPTAYTDNDEAENKKKIMLACWLGGSAALVLLLAIVILNWGRGDDKKDNQNLAKANPTKSDVDNGKKPSGKKPPDEKPPKNKIVEKNPDVIKYQTIVDDDKVHWASPTEGKNVELKYVPGNAQIFLFVRPADILAQPEGALALQALGPEFAAIRKQWETASGFKLDEVEQLIIGLHDNQGRLPRPSFVVRLREKSSQEDLLAKWGNPTPSTVAEKGVYNSRGWSFYVPGQSDLFVMAAAQEIEDVIRLNGNPPTLRRQMKELSQWSDDQRHFTVLFAPNYLFSDGRELFSGARQKIIDPLSRLLGDDLRAGMFSMHFGELFYIEMRLVGEHTKGHRGVAVDLSKRLDQVPDNVSDYIVKISSNTYWEKFRLRFLDMVDQLHEQIRVEALSDHVVINSIAHGSAAHNFIFGTEMVIASAVGSGPVAVAKPIGPKTVEEVMAGKVSLSFGQTSLEFAVRDLALEANETFSSLPFNFKIKIIGGDLEKDGITRNQQIRDFKQEDQTVADILTEIVRKANPVTTVKKLSEMDQKLLWVIQPDPDSPGNKIVLVTTRNASEQKGYQLPKVFQPE